MDQLKVFFDYACPYCFKAHGYLAELHLKYPQIEILWHPCEAHPRPDRYGPHSDLCIQGLFFARDHGADLWAYHDRMYQAVWKARANIENVRSLSEVVQGLLDPEAFRKSLERGTYANALREANRYAYDLSGVWAVPAYRMNGQKLNAVEDVGVTKEQLFTFAETARRGET